MGGRNVTNHDMKNEYWEGMHTISGRNEYWERIWAMGKLLFRINPR